MKRIVYAMPDGHAEIVHPAPNAMREGETEDEFVARVRAKDVPPDAKDVTLCDPNDIPADRTFRNAWKRGVSALVEVDMPKAREIHMDRIREARDAELRRLDIEQMKGEDVTAEKQRLRDIPQTFDLTTASTPEELKALWPDELQTIK